MLSKSPRWLLPLLLGLLVLVPAAAAQDVAISDDQVNEVAKDLFCPVCESTPLDVCPTQACKDWREVIRTKLAEGESKPQIMEYFRLQYGDRVLAEPPRSGFDLIVWLLPIVGVVGGAFFFARYLNRLRASPATDMDVPADPTLPPSERIDDDYLARVERELRDSS